MARNMGKKVRRAGETILPILSAEDDPGRVLVRAIAADRRRAAGGYVECCRSSVPQKEKAQEEEPRSILPCLTAATIEVMKKGSPGRVMRKWAKAGAD